MISKTPDRRFQRTGICNKLLDHASDELCDRDLEQFIEHLKDRIEKWAKYGKDPITDVIMAVLQMKANKDNSEKG